MKFTTYLNPTYFVTLLVTGLLFLGGCSSPIKKANKPDMDLVLAATKDISTEMHSSVLEIDNKNNIIKELAPELSPQTSVISEHTAKLFELEKKLDATRATLATEKTKMDENIKIIKQLEGKVSDLESSRYGLLSKILAVVAVMSLIIGVVGVVWLHSPKIGMTAGILFSVCIAAQWILAYALYIALAVILTIIGIIVYIIIKERNALQQTVNTVEAVKPYIPNFKDVVQGIQSRPTEHLVSKLQKHTRKTIKKE